MRQDHQGACGETFDALTNIDNYSRAFESGSRRKRRPDRVFSLNLVQVRWIDRRGAHLHDRFVRRRCRPRVRLHAQHIRRISVRFINGHAYIFFHR